MFETLLILTTLAVLHGDVDGLVLVVAEDEGLEYHAFVPVQKGEYHVQVDEGLGGAGQLLYDDVAASLWSEGSETGGKQVDALGAGAGAVAQQEDVVTGDEDVAALHIDVRVAGLVVVGVDDAAAELSAALVDGFHEGGRGRSSPR